MATAAKKITLSPSRDIPFNKLVLSQANVRRIKAGVSIEELAEDIARRGLLQGLSVRPVLDDAGTETGMFEIPAGGRRYRALELLVKQKRLARTAPVPCVVREGGIAEEDSLAENVQRAPLHPLDQFRAFLALREKGQPEEEIAAAFFVAVNVVKQRLKLASVSPRLLETYAEDGMTLDQLMAFTVYLHARIETLVGIEPKSGDPRKGVGEVQSLAPQTVGGWVYTGAIYRLEVSPSWLERKPPPNPLDPDDDDAQDEDADDDPKDLFRQQIWHLALIGTAAAPGAAQAPGRMIIHATQDTVAARLREFVTAGRFGQVTSGDPCGVPFDDRVLQAHCLEGDARQAALWGLHRAVKSKPDRKSLMGLDLKEAMDPFSDQTYRLTSAVSINKDRTPKFLGLSLKHQRVWSQKGKKIAELSVLLTKLFDDLGAVDLAAAAEPVGLHQTGYRDLARTSDPTAIHDAKNAFEAAFRPLSTLDPLPETDDDEAAKEGDVKAEKELAWFADGQVKFGVAIAGTSGFTLEVFRKDQRLRFGWSSASSPWRGLRNSVAHHSTIARELQKTRALRKPLSSPAIGSTMVSRRSSSSWVLALRGSVSVAASSMKARTSKVIAVIGVSSLTIATRSGSAGRRKAFAWASTSPDKVAESPMRGTLRFSAASRRASWAMIWTPRGVPKKAWSSSITTAFRPSNMAGPMPRRSRPSSDSGVIISTPSGLRSAAARPVRASPCHGRTRRSLALNSGFKRVVCWSISAFRGQM